jgi:hypothetical protein
MLYPFTPCGLATPETVAYPQVKWQSSTPLDTPRRTPMVVARGKSIERKLTSYRLYSTVQYSTVQSYYYQG